MFILLCLILVWGKGWGHVEGNGNKRGQNTSILCRNKGTRQKTFKSSKGI